MLTEESTRSSGTRDAISLVPRARKFIHSITVRTKITKNLYQIKGRKKHKAGLKQVWIRTGPG